ncbi:MAG: hypothetical protein RLZZ312_332 [Bacteroidota bacterium]
MKHLQILAFSMLFSLTIQAQDFQGMIVYESKTNTADFKSRISLNKDMTPEMQKTIEERMKKMSEKTFILHFDKNASIYAEEEKLDTPNTRAGGGGRMMASFMGAGGTLYKNIKEKTFTLDKEMMGKEFLIKDTLTNYKWKMTSETKKIGNYTCFKATATRPVSKTDFRNMRPKKEEESADKKTDKPKSTNFMNNMDMPKTVEITAWYTPEIPLNQGPEGYWGLPGIILEVSAGKTVILGTKVAMNIKDRKEIKPATKGDIMTQAKYDEVIVKKMQEMQEMFQGQAGRPGMGGGGFRMGR